MISKHRYQRVALPAALLWLASSACRAPESAAAPSPQAAGSAATAARPLPKVERSRLEYALSSLDRLSRQFTWAGATQTCVLLIASDAQWVVNCPTIPQGFQRTGEDLRGLPVYSTVADSVTVEGEKLPIATLVQMLPGTVQVPGMPHGPSLGGELPYLIVCSIDALMQFHPAFQHDSSSDEWLAIFVHEFFHTRQLMHPALSAILPRLQPGGLDQAPLAAWFAEDTSYAERVRREYDVLSAAAALDDGLTREAALEALQQWRELYEQRHVIVDQKGLALADDLFTYLEGSARYVEVMFLSHPDWRSGGTLEGDPHFEDFRRFSPPGYARLFNRKLGREYYAALGMHLGLVLDRADPTWKLRVAEHPRWLVGVALDLAAERKLAH
jgi:hypothetical protein